MRNTSISSFDNGLLSLDVVVVEDLDGLFFEFTAFDASSAALAVFSASNDTFITPKICPIGIYLTSKYFSHSFTLGGADVVVWLPDIPNRFP